MANHFIVYSVRNGVESFFKGITDPSFFVGINKILADKLYLHYVDPLHNETHAFSGLLEFVCAKEGLDIVDWVPFMKALQAQDDGTEAKTLYWHMVKIDARLSPYGTSEAYLVGRLKRDRPDLAEALARGEIKSARAAAIEAGIIKPVPSIQLKEPSPTAQKLLAKKGREWCLQLLEELSELVL